MHVIDWAGLDPRGLLYSVSEQRFTESQIECPVLTPTTGITGRINQVLSEGTPNAACSRNVPTSIKVEFNLGKLAHANASTS